MRVTLFAAALLLSLLIGCADQSQIAGPVSSSDYAFTALAKTNEAFKVDMKLIGPGGIKYAVVGTIDYILKNDGETVTLVTNVGLKIARSGSQDYQKVSGGNAFSFNRGPGKTDVVSESYAITSASEGASRVWVQYSIQDCAVNLSDIQIISGDAE
jgi:hypothetical protein